MDKNETFVITINRELGSGGRTVGEKLAQKLGVSFFDKALIKELEQKYHLNAEEIEKLKSKKNGWWADFQRMVVPFYDTAKATYYSVEIGKEPKQITTAQMFKAETAILSKLAEEGSCVVAGRSAFFVFRNHPNHLSILIQAPIEHRIQRVMKKQGLSREDAIKVIGLVDKGRENYVKTYTNTSRYDTRNYDLVINMDGLSEDDAVALILAYLDNIQS